VNFGVSKTLKTLLQEKAKRKGKKVAQLILTKSRATQSNQTFVVKNLFFFPIHPFAKKWSKKRLALCGLVKIKDSDGET
jgi:hypothetical protein